MSWLATFVYALFLYLLALFVLRWSGIRDYLLPSDALMIASDAKGVTLITTVLTFDTHLSLPQLRQVLQARLLQHKPFTHRVVAPRWGWSRWQKYAFTLDDHLMPHKLSDSSSKEELQALASRLQQTGLDQGRALWQMHVIETYSGEPGCASAVIIRVHHALGDGVALARLLLSLNVKSHGDGDGDDNAVTTASTAAPPHSKPQQREKRGGCQAAAAVASAAAKLLLVRQDPAGPWKREFVVEKTRMGWSSALPLDRFKAIARRMSATVNDVMLACMFGAMRDTMVESGALEAANPVLTGAERPPQAVCWAALRSLKLLPPPPASQATRRQVFGNRIGVCYVPMFLAETDPVKRVADVSQLLSRLKRSAQPLVSYALLALIGLLPSVLAGAASRAVGYKTSMSFSNFPGPQFPMYFADHKVNSIIVSTRPHHTLHYFFLLMSYNGTVRMAMSSEQRTLADVPHARLFAHFEAQLESLDRLSALHARATRRSAGSR